MGFYERAQAYKRLQTPLIAHSGSDASLYYALRNDLEEQLSVDYVIDLAKHNKMQAEAEVKKACEQLLLRPDYKALSAVQAQALIQELVYSIFGLGIIEPLIDEPSVTEIMINGTQAIFYEEAGVLKRYPQTFRTKEEIRAVIDKILGPLGRRVDELSPLVDARLQQGYRVNVALNPIAMNGPVVTIRKFPEHVITLDDMCAAGSAEWSVARCLQWAVESKKSLAVCGSTGAGKTTLLNALSCCIPKSERIITIEDSAELRFFEHPHVIGLEARPLNAEGNGLITIRDLVANALRMRPDRIVVGECRGSEALDMLQAMNTGHEGSLTTLHANSPHDSISRLIMMVRFGIDLPTDVIKTSISTALKLIVQVKRSVSGGRYISDIVEVLPAIPQQACPLRELYVRNTMDEQGRWLAAPSWLSDARACVGAKKEVEEWYQRTGLSCACLKA